MGSGTDVARESSDVILIGSDLSKLVETLRIARRCRGVIMQNFVGTLVVDMFDVHTKKLVWRGSASDTLSDKSDKNIKNLDKGVQKMFDHFPPGQKN